MEIKAIEKTKLTNEMVNIPANTIAIELLNDSLEPLAILACRHDGSIAEADFSNDRDMEALFQFEQEIIHAFLKTDKKIAEQYAWSGRIIATDSKAEILYQCRNAD